jgi:hypothetical protein
VKVSSGLFLLQTLRRAAAARECVREELVAVRRAVGLPHARRLLFWDALVSAMVLYASVVLHMPMHLCSAKQLAHRRNLKSFKSSGGDGRASEHFKVAVCGGGGAPYCGSA